MIAAAAIVGTAVRSLGRANAPMISQPAAGTTADAKSAAASSGSQGYADQNSVSATVPTIVGPTTNDRNRRCDQLSPRPTKFMTT